MTRTVKLAISVFVLLIAVGGIWRFGAFAQKESPEKSEVTFKYIVNNLGDITPLDIAIEKGFFEEQGIKIETVGVAGGGAAAIQAILGGSADIGGAAMPAYINAIKGEAKIKVIYGGAAMAHAKDPGYSWIVREDSGINSAKDLIGKTIAMGARGAMWEYGTKEYLRKNGIAEDQVSILIVPPPQYEQVLRSKQVDAVVAGPPIADNILEGGNAKILASLYEILGEKLAGGGFGYIVRQDTIDKNPEAVKRLVAAYEKADEWAVQNPEEARKVVAAVLQKRGQNPVIAKYWKPLNLRDHGKLVDEDVQFWLDWFVRDGKIKEGQIKPSDVYTNEFNPYYGK